MSIETEKGHSPSNESNKTHLQPTPITPRHNPSTVKLSVIPEDNQRLPKVLEHQHCV